MRQGTGCDDTDAVISTVGRSALRPISVKLSELMSKKMTKSDSCEKIKVNKNLFPFSKESRDDEYTTNE